MPEGTVLSPYYNAVLDSETGTSGGAGNILRTKQAFGPRDSDYGDVLSKFRYTSAGPATQQAVKTGPGVMGGIYGVNTSGAAVFVQIFDKTSANVTPGTTAPDMEFYMAATTGTLSITFAEVVGFVNAITIFMSTASAGGTGSAAGAQFTATYA